MARDGTGEDPRAVDYRKHPELYRIGRGELGVLTFEPYKSELLPLWRFKTPDVARESAGKLTGAFEAYREAGDFVGMDMARKFLQMGYTRSRRYANHKGGRKYRAGTGEVLPADFDGVKAESAEVFREALAGVKADPEYQRLKAEHQAAGRAKKARPG